MEWRIDWMTECDICKCPLDIRIKIEEGKIDTLLKVIMSTVEESLIGNEKYVHINGENMCTYCYNKGWMTHEKLMEREIKRCKLKGNKARRREDLDRWSERVWRKVREKDFNWKEHYEKLTEEGARIENVEIYSGEMRIEFEGNLIREPI